MAKDRRITPSPTSSSVSSNENLQREASLFSEPRGRLLTSGLLAAILIYAAFWTHDSVEVPQGAARYLVLAILMTCALAFTSFRTGRVSDLTVEICLWAVAVSMGISVLINASQSNVRLGINELGWWIAIPALVCIVRRVATTPAAAGSLMKLCFALAVGVTVYGWHQVLIGFPEMIELYEANPDAMLRQLGIDPQRNPSLRIVFENRLRDGGPTGTFALANSLAAMLVGAVVAMVGWFAMSWRVLSLPQKVTWAAAIMMVAGMLLATRSRTAVLAMVAVAMMYAVRATIKNQKWTKLITSRPKHSALLAGITAVGFALTAFVMRNSEWFQQAPASLAFRLRYWVACWKLFLQSPWFGIGPGQFKARYELVRAEASLEQIADPHNLLLQTLVTGGAVALLFLVIGLVALAWLSLFRMTDYVADDAQTISPPSRNAVMPGAIIATLCVWFLGAATGQLPSVEPAFLATVVACLFAFVISRNSKQLNSVRHWGEIRTIALYSVLAIGIDLLASGGITVPGISVFAWTMLGIAAPIQHNSEQNAPEPTSLLMSRRLGSAAIVVAAILWYTVGIAPIEQAKVASNKFNNAWSSGQMDQAIDALERSMAADRWDAEPAIQLVNALRSMATLDRGRAGQWEQRWAAAESEAASRAEADPVVLRQLADQRLIHYQQFGNREMLVAANKLYQRAVELAPSHETYTAQWAEVLRELGDPRAREIALRAESLAAAGGYYERMLNFIVIFPAKFLGANKDGEVTDTAENVLRPLLDQK